MNDFESKPVDPSVQVESSQRWFPPRPVRCSPPAAEVAHGEEDFLRKFGNIDGLDVPRGLALMGGRQELYLRQLRAFVQLRGGDAAELRKEFAAGDLAALDERVHRLCGSAGSIGAVAVHAAAEALQRRLRQSTSCAVLTPDVDVLAHRLDALVAGLAAALPDLPTP